MCAPVSVVRHSVMKHHDQRKGLFGSDITVRGSQGRSWGRNQERMLHCSLLSWCLAKPAFSETGFLYNPDYLGTHFVDKLRTTSLGVALPTVGWFSLHQSLIQKMLPETCLHFLNWSSLFLDDRRFCQFDKTNQDSVHIYLFVCIYVFIYKSAI